MGGLIEHKTKGVKYRIDDNLKGNLDLLMKSVSKGWDNVMIIDGREGTAKSTLGKMICFYLSKGKFNVDNIVFTAEQFIQAVEKAPIGSAILFDEMVMAGMSSDAMSGMQKMLIKKFTLIRKKQLHIVLIIPYFFMLQKYFAIGRTRCLIHNFSSDGISRGSFKFYNEDKKRSLYVRNYKFWYYPEERITFNFYGHFDDYTGKFIDEEAYEKKKDEALAEIGKEEPNLKPSKTVAKALCDAPITNLYEPSSKPYKNIMAYLKKCEEFYKLDREKYKQQTSTN